MYSTSSASRTRKTLAACDECRTRKLKCSGEPTGCLRCITERTLCHYSLRKTMGRPRKRPRQEKDFAGHNDGIDFDPFDTSIDDITSNGYQIFDVPTTEGGGGHQNKATARKEDGSTRLEPEDLDINFESIQIPEFDFTVPLPTYDLPQAISAHPPLDVLDPNLFQATTSPETSMTNTTSTTTNPSQTSCNCLPTLYTTLSTFQSPPAPSFPYSMSHLRSARKCAQAVVHCPTCPEAYNTAVQNSMLLCALLQMLINEYAKLVAHIDERASSGEMITYRLGEVADTYDIRHTGGPDCPMGINLDLEGEEWRMLARKAIKAEVRGSGQGKESLQEILQEMRDRQERWHNNFPKEGHAHAKRSQHAEEKESGAKKGECICTQILHIDQLRRGLEALNI